MLLFICLHNYLAFIYTTLLLRECWDLKKVMHIEASGEPITSHDKVTLSICLCVFAFAICLTILLVIFVLIPSLQHPAK